MSSSKYHFFKSVRFKFLVWYMVALTITLLIFSTVLYGGFRKILYGDLDDLLSSKADGIANSIDTYYETGETLKADPALGMSDLAKVAADWMDQRRKDPELMSIFAQILDVKGSKLVSSKQMPNIEALDKEDFEDILDGEDSFDTLDGYAADGKKMRFRVYTRPVAEGGRVMYIVQVAGPVTLVSLALNSLILALFVLLPLTVLLAGIPGVLLVRLTLKPVDRMIDTLRQITAENLKLKIHIPDTRDEIKRLADTFNDMIERLDRSFSSQQRFIQDISNELETLVGASGEGEKISRTIEDLEILSSFDDNRAALHINRIPLCRLARAALDEVKARAAEKDIVVSFSCSEDIMLDADEAQIKRLLKNIYDNAVKYTYRKGKMSVTVRTDGENAKIYVSDTGVGIPEDEQAYIFDRFYQARGSQRGVKNGFGLGLSTARSIADAHKGDIAVESQPGKGSTFTITLPLTYPG